MKENKIWHYFMLREIFRMVHGFAEKSEKLKKKTSFPGNFDIFALFS